MLNERFTLSNGVTIPKIGFGTWMIDNAKAAKDVRDAIRVGYRHIDTAQAYTNEAGVGEGIRTSGVDRKDLFVTTKLAAEIKNYKEALTAIDESLEKLGLDYIDLMIIHSPKPWAEFQNDEKHFFEGNLEAWRALEEAYEAGKLRAIGVSNFEQADLENLLANAKVKPMVNQILAHIGHTPLDVINFSQQNDILVEAYSPIAHGAMMRNEAITAMADKYQVSIPQLAIRYCLQLDLLPLPKTENIEHMKNNADVDFTISEEDMDALKTIGRVDYGDHSDIPVFRRATDN
ncbi:aldo/keto reductase [Candidatus Enterococcus ferrettii]|uniref:NADP-dependent oxidoreductase domain-containing protein n=1 Tax=Candidatus Enterococcus ferrettii TaxID=2815324 RepID=A0ABV0EJ07_9ENTE|nr:aldo/keto reductase [Enterococcus sp. 665A]MBO1340682.1 aldo/keto reductase [Enterococcus sp. 665A]